LFLILFCIFFCFPCVPPEKKTEPDSVKANFTYTPQKDVLEDPT